MNMCEKGENFLSLLVYDKAKSHNLFVPKHILNNAVRCSWGVSRQQI